MPANTTSAKEIAGLAFEDGFAMGARLIIESVELALGRKLTVDERETALKEAKKRDEREHLGGYLRDIALVAFDQHAISELIQWRMHALHTAMRHLPGRIDADAGKPLKSKAG